MQINSHPGRPCWAPSSLPNEKIKQHRETGGGGPLQGTCGRRPLIKGTKGASEQLNQEAAGRLAGEGGGQ